MTRTLTAAVALAAGLGLAGMAQAQQNASNYEHGGKPTAGQQAAPSAYTSPSTTSPTPNASTGATPQTMPASPQANGTTGNMQGSMQTGEMGMTHRNMRGGERTTVAQAQKELKSQGFYNGPIDGIIGPETKTALSQFQQKNGLKQSAQLDRQTRERLEQGGNNSGQQNPAPVNSGANMQHQNPPATNGASH